MVSLVAMDPARRKLTNAVDKLGGFSPSLPPVDMKQSPTGATSCHLQVQGAVAITGNSQVVNGSRYNRSLARCAHSNCQQDATHKVLVYLVTWSFEVPVPGTRSSSSASVPAYQVGDQATHNIPLSTMQTERVVLFSTLVLKCRCIKSIPIHRSHHLLIRRLHTNKNHGSCRGAWGPSFESKGFSNLTCRVNQV